MTQAQTHRLVIPNDFDAARKAQAEVVEAAGAQGFDEDSLFAIRLALDEALCNAVRHGNCNDPTKHVIVEYSIAGDRLKVSITDEGCGFIPERLPDPTADENLERPNGRGVMLMKAYMTDVSFNDQGNRVTMVKVRGCKGPKEE